MVLDLGVFVIVEYEGKIFYIDIEKIVFLGNGDILSILLIMY